METIAYQCCDRLESAFYIGLKPGSNAKRQTPNVKHQPQRIQGDNTVIIDCHGHLSPPPELWVYKSHIMSHRGEHGRKMPEVTDEEILFYANKREMGPCGHCDMLDRVGTDIQMLSPRPFQMMHSVKPGKPGALVHGRNQQPDRTQRAADAAALRRHRRPAAGGWRP